MNSFDATREGYMWRIGDGASTSFRYDNWVGHGPLCNYVTEVDARDCNLRVCDALNAQGMWDLEHFNTRLDNSVIDRVHAVPISRHQDSVNRRIWGQFLCIEGNSFLPRSIPSLCLFRYVSPVVKAFSLRRRVSTSGGFSSSSYF